MELDQIRPSTVSGMSRASLERIERCDLRRLAALAEESEAGLFSRLPNGAGRYAGRLLCRALCQSSALHYLDGRTGVKVDGGRQDEGAVFLMLLHPGDRSGLDQAPAYFAGLSAGKAAFSTWDISERPWRDFGLAVLNRSGRTDGADNA